MEKRQSKSWQADDEKSGQTNHATSDNPSQRERLFAVALAVLPILLTFGGAGNAYPLIGTTVQIAALVLLGVVATGRKKRQALLVRCGLILAAATFALPMLQLVPLPSGMWPDTPSIRLRDAIRAALGSKPFPRALTLDSDETIAAALHLIPALALFAATIRLSPHRQRILLTLVVITAAVSACLGVFQLSALFQPFVAGGHARYAIGLFVNRNHQATFLNAALVLTPVAIPTLMPSSRGPMRLWVMAVVAALFAGGVLATTSRAGLVMLLPALTIGSAIASPWRLRMPVALAGALVLALASMLATQLSAAQRVLARFQDTDDRMLYWQASWPAVHDFWPLGSGLGTFTRVFPHYERDAMIKAYTINAAHNDFLQLLLEGGLPALALMVAGIGLFSWATIQLMRASPTPGAAVLNRRTGLAAAAAILLILLHSVVDYPLRMMSLLAVFGLLAGVLLSAADRLVAKADR